MLKDWNGGGGGNLYKWKKENEKVECKYVEEEHKLEVTYSKNNKEEFSKEEKLNTGSKPNVFIMRKSSERIVNQFMKE
jgi:hypothetical protein